MKKRYAVLLLFALFAVAVLGDDITTIDGTVYKDIRVTEITPLGINFDSNAQACWIDFRDLPADVAKKYGYDPVKAAEFEKALDQNQGNAVTGNQSVMVGDNTVLEENTNPAQEVNVAGGTATGGAVVNAPSVPSPQVIIVNNGDPVIYNQQIIYEAATSVWVLWAGRYYPRSYWHYWYWKDRYVSWNGRYYPAHCYYRGGAWDRGQNYNYAPEPRRNLHAWDRDSSRSYSIQSDNHIITKKHESAVNSAKNRDNIDHRRASITQVAGNDNRRNLSQSGKRSADNKSQPVKNTTARDSDKNQAVMSAPRVANRIQANNNDNSVKVQNIAPAIQVNQDSLKNHNTAKDNQVPSQSAQIFSDNRAKVQNVTSENRKLTMVQFDNQSAAKTQNTARNSRVSIQTAQFSSDNHNTNVVNDSTRTAQPAPGDNRLSAVAVISDSRGSNDYNTANNREWTRREGRR